MEVARFPFRRIGKEYLGIIYRPYVYAFLKHTKDEEWFPVEMIADTGADYTLLPRRYADLLGIDLNTDCIAQTSAGIGASETVYLYKGLIIKIESFKKEIPVGFLERDDIPALLGRLGMIEALRVIFEKFATTFERPKR